MGVRIDNLVDTTVQCWGCGVFDQLFKIVSDSAAAAYQDIVIICVVLFGVLFAFVVLNMVWQNIKGGEDDPFHQKTIKPLVINSLIALTLLGAGVGLPRLVSRVTFEPTADLTLAYTQAMTHTTNEIVDSRVTYESSVEISEQTSMFRPQLRDTIIDIMKTVTTQFQSYIKLGFAILSNAFSNILGIGALLKHIILIFIGLYLVYGFFKLFVKFCFYFVDIIVAMLFFSFLFPIGITLASFKGNGVPKWVSSLGSTIGSSQIKQVINAIIGLAAAVVTYTIIMVILSNFFTPDQANDLIQNITTGDVDSDSGLFSGDIAENNPETLSISKCVVLLYIITYLQSKIPEITSMIMKVFDVKPETSMGDDMGTRAMNFTSNQVKQFTKIGKDLINAHIGKTAGTTGGATGGTTP